MASTESEFLTKLNEAMLAHMRSSMLTPLVGDDTSVAYRAGFNQGLYKGLIRSQELLALILEDKAKKDNLL